MIHQFTILYSQINFHQFWSCPAFVSTKQSSDHLRFDFFSMLAERLAPRVIDKIPPFLPSLIVEKMDEWFDMVWLFGIYTGMSWISGWSHDRLDRNVNIRNMDNFIQLPSVGGTSKEFQIWWVWFSPKVRFPRRAWKQHVQSMSTTMSSFQTSDTASRTEWSKLHPSIIFP